MTHKRNGTIITPKDEWGTPPELFKQLDNEFHFDCDAACTAENRLVDIFYDKAGDALNPKADWNSTAYLNPPYSQGNIERFMKKAYEQSQKRTTVVCLVPVAADTRWWHDYVMHAHEIRFIKGRVKFIGYDDQGNAVKNSPTFSSCIVIFRPNNSDPFRVPVIGKTIVQGRK